MILPEVRTGFGRDEARVLVRLLDRHGVESREHWEAVLAERGIDPLLDHPATLQAVLDEPGVSALPLRLVGYVLLRHSLLEGGIGSRMLADYLASLVVHFASPRRSYRIAEYDDREYFYLVDILQELEEAQGRRAFLLRAHLGNFALWLSGLFPDHIVHRVNRKGGPGIDYYQEMGQTGYLLAADDPFARRQALDRMYRDVATAFVPMRRALNRFSDRYLTPRAESPIDRLLRQVTDEFESGWLQA